MSTERPRNMAASVSARLLQISKQRKEEFQLVLTRYANERLLYRLSLSTHTQGFVLKGATLFAHWTGEVHRPTRDLDLLGHGNPQTSHIVDVFKQICQEPVEDDGLQYLPETVTGAIIKEGEEYEGVRIKLTAKLGGITIPVQVDVGFGDAITPAAQVAELPTLLAMPAAKMLTYPRETVVAEKCQAMVKLALANSRLKDFYDLWYLATHFDFDGMLLAEAVAATFERRETELPSQLPIALTPAYYEDASNKAQWQKFVSKSNLPADQTPSFEAIINLLISFLMPLLSAAAGNVAFHQAWNHQSLTWTNTAAENLVEDNQTEEPSA